MKGEPPKGVVLDRSLRGKSGDTGRCWGPRHKSGVRTRNCRTSEDGKGASGSASWRGPKRGWPQPCGRPLCPSHSIAGLEVGMQRPSVLTALSPGPARNARRRCQ